MFGSQTQSLFSTKNDPSTSNNQGLFGSSKQTGLFGVPNNSYPQVNQMDDSEKKGLFGTSNTLFSGMSSGGLFGSENQGIFGGNIDGKFGSSRIFEGNN